jgi:hypothetical protein
MEAVNLAAGTRHNRNRTPGLIRLPRGLTRDTRTFLPNSLSEGDDINPLAIIESARARVQEMTPAVAILVGAIVVGVAIILARIIAPYELALASNADGALILRLNTITGDVQICLPLNIYKHIEPKCQ